MHIIKLFDDYHHDKFQPLNSWEKIYNFHKDPEFYNLFYSNEWSDKDLKMLKTVLNDKQSYVLLYHGTACNLPIENEGLKRTKRSTKKSLQSEEGYVYLSVYPDMAKTFGKLAYPNTEICVYEVFVKIKYLLPDHDQLKNKRLWGEMSIGKTLMDSLLYGHGARVKRDILPYEIKKY